MRQIPVMAALLCLAAGMSVVYATQGAGRNCCLQWSTTVVPVARIVNYTIQSEGACPIQAIIFKTVAGKTLCSDPKSRWAIKACKKVDEESKRLIVQENEDSEDGSSSDITPAASTKSKNVTKRRGKGRKRQRNRKTKRGKNQQRKHV